MTLELGYSARSHVGMVRKGNEDSGYAGPHLLVVADGMGGHAFGEVASAAAVNAMLVLPPEIGAAGFDPEAALRAAVSDAGDRLRRLVAERPELEGMGTTLIGLLQIDERVVIAHVGDSRAYLLRHGVLEQVTHDHTFVQSLVDEGRISQDEARTHPQRSLILQALDGRVDVEPDIIVRKPVVGDRYLLCSDGLSGVLSEATMREVLMVGTTDQAVDQLVDLALRGGAPDNVTCVVADVVEANDPEDTDDTDDTGAPVLVGAAAESLALETATTPGHGGSPTDAADDGDDGRRPRGIRLLLPIVLLLVLVAVAGFFGYRWTQTQYYVGAHAGQVAIYRGVPQHLIGHSLSSVVEPSEMRLTDLPEFAQDQVNATIPAGSLGLAHQIIARLRLQAATCTQYPEPAGCAPGLAVAPTPSPTPAVTPSPSASKT
jgi:serine/threonine protein phosphatase PrpC